MIKDPIQKGQVGGEDLGGGQIGDRSQTWRIMVKWGEMARVLQGMVILDTLVVLKHFDRGRMDKGQGFDLKISDIRAQFYGIIQKIRFRTPLYEDDEGPCVYADGGRKV